jgi:flagellar basal body-associated protein FliL
MTQEGGGGGGGQGGIYAILIIIVILILAAVLYMSGAFGGGRDEDTDIEADVEISAPDVPGTEREGGQPAERPAEQPTGAEDTGGS